MIIVLFVIALIIYVYHQKVREHELTQEINDLQQIKIKKIISDIPKTTCPSPVETKCKYNPDKDEYKYKCTHVDQYGLTQEIEDECCPKSCKTIKNRIADYKANSIDFPKPTLPKPPVKNPRTFWCYHKYKEVCFPKEYDYSDYSKNRCPGNSTTSQGSSQAFDSEAQCHSTKLLWKDWDQKECLKNTGYGWCTDNRGAGQCVEGSAEGPYNQEKYDCMPGEGRTDPSSFGEVPPNTYVYGQTNPYIGPGSGNTYKHVLGKK